jgi:hypothetical protein
MIGLMADHDYPLTKEEFDSIYSKVPRLTVEVIVKNRDGAIYLAKRAIEPCVGKWHIPGGTVYFGESAFEALKRVAKNKLAITVTEAVNRGYIEYPSHYNYRLDEPVGLVFEVTDYSGEIKPYREFSEGGWFTKLPENMHADQDDFLLEHHYVNR